MDILCDFITCDLSSGLCKKSIDVMFLLKIEMPLCLNSVVFCSKPMVKTGILIC